MAYDPELLNQEYEPLDTVVNDQEFLSSNNKTRLDTVKGWAEYSTAYYKKNLDEAPEMEKPQRQKEFDENSAYVKERVESLSEKYSLQHRLSKAQTSGDVIDVLRPVEKLIAEGFPIEEIQGLRAVAVENFGPILAASQAGTLSENEAAKALWEEPNFVDKAANFANQVLPMAAIMAAKAVEGGANFMRNSVTIPGVPVPIPTAVANLFLKGAQTNARIGPKLEDGLLENVAGAAKGVSEWVGKESPLDPRFSGDTSAFISGAAQMPGNLALGLAGAPVNATSNYLQMFQENLDAYEPEISKARYDAEVESGKTSASTPFKQWQSLLSKDDKEDIRAEAATKAMVVAMPQAALETVSDALLLKHIPLPAAIKKKLPSFLRNAAPKTFIGGKIVGQFLAKTGIEGGTEGAQTVMKNVGSAINTGDWSGENLTEGVRESFIGGVAGGGVATALRIPNTFRTEKALDWALGVSTGRLDSDAQKDIAILRNPEIDKSSPEYQEAYSRFSTRNNTDRQHQFDLATIASPTEDQSPSEIKAAKARVSAREDEAHWVLSKLESEDADPIRAQRYQAKTAAQKDFQDSIAQHLQKSAVDWDPSGEKLRARAQEIEDSFSKVEANAKAIGSNLDVAAAKKMALDQLLGTQDKQAQAAEDSFLDALGSSDSAGPLRAKFARQELMRLYPEQNAHLTPWFKDDSTVVEMLNARENEEIDDDTNLDSWLASPEGIKSTTSDKKTDTATEEKPKGLMTVGQRRDAFRLAEDNAEASGDENQKKEFARLKEDVDFWHSVLSDTESNEQDKAEAKAKLPALEGSLLDLATAPVEDKSLNQAANEQNQPPSQASVSNQEVSPTSPESSRTGKGTPFTVVRTMDGGETTQTEQDYINESREIVKSLTGRGEIKMTPEAALQNVEAVRQEIESAPDLTPEQKQQWSSHFDNIPLVVQQLNSTGTTLPTSEPVSETTAGAPIPIAQPTPVRMGGVTGDLTRTESGEAVFSPTDNSPETVLRVKETSIEKDPATLTVEDFESGDGTPLVSETDKQFSVLPQNERLVRPFFRSEPAPLSPAEQPKRGETQNEIQQTESLREGQSQPLRQGQSSSSAEGQSSSLQGQEITYQTTAQDGQMAKSSGSYPEDAGSTPAPATPEEAQLRAIRAALPKPPSAVGTEQAATPAPTRTRADVESSPEGVAIVKKYDRHYEMVSDFDLNLGDATRAQAVALTNKLLKAGAITESDAAEALRLAKDKGYDREDAVSEAASVLQGAVEFRKDQQIDELLATPVAEAATPSPAIDTATITADVQANPDAHRRIQGRKREVSREGAVAILTQLPESFTKQDAINIAKDAGMSRERLTKLAALRNDPNSVSSILSGAMDAELGLFDRNAEPTEDAAVPPAIPETNAEVSKKDTTKPAVTPNQSPADRWVYTGMAAFEETLRGLKGSKYDQLRAALDSDTGRADLQRKLAGVFNIKVQKTLKAGGVLDPVVLEDTTEKILYGNVSQNDPGSITKNVMGDLLSNLEQTGDPFRVGSGVAYDASGRVRNQSKPAREIQSRRDRGLVSESTDGDGNLVNPRSETPSGVTMLGTTDTAPERAANKELAQEREHQAMQDGFHEVIEGLVKRGKGSYYDVTLAVAHIFEKAHGIGIADPVALGWKSPDSKGRVKKTVLKTLTPLSGEINKNLIRAMRDHLDKAIRLNREEGLLDSPAVSMDLASILKANIYESLISEDKFKPAIQKAREQKSTAPLMPVLAEIGRNDVANIQSVVQNVLNNGKPFASHRDITSLTQSDMQAVLDSGLLSERVQETLQALVDLNGDGMALLRNSTNEGWRRWSEILGEQIGNRAPVQVMFNLALDPSVTGQGLWKEGTNTVHISPFLTREPGLMESTMLHEMMHPIWDWKVTAFQRGDQSQLNQKEIAALTELSGLFDLVNKEAQSRLSTITDPAALSKAQRDLLGASNLREFLNEAINHKPFQDFLAELKDPDAKGKGGLLRRIVNAILRLIRGGEVAADSILQRSFELSLDLANYTDRELPIAERNKTQIDYFKSLEAERGRPLTLPEYERASVDFALKYPQPRIANTPAEASRLAQETLTPDELDAFNEYQRTKNEPVLASEMVTEAQEIYDAIKANGGITVDVWDGSRPSSGIVVAPFKETETTFSLNEFTANDVKDYMEKFRPLLEVSGMHLGGWVSNDTAYLDVSIVTEDEVTATALAQDGNQLATFNLGNFTQLDTPDLLAKYGGEGGEVSRLRSETRYKDLRRSLQQALGRAMGGIQRTDSPNVSGQGNVQERTSPEIDLVEALTGETPTAEEAAKILESSPVPTYYDNLTNKGTDPITGIRTAIGRAAKRGNGAGRNAAQGNEGPLVRGSDFPDEIRRGDRETHQELERARSGINEALGGSLPFQSLELIKQLTGQANAPEGSELAQTIDALRNKIPVLPNNALEGLKQLSEGMSSKVFVDTKNDSAYKLLSVSDKGSVGGTFPKDIRIRAADDTVVIASEKNPSLLEFLRAVAISNVQGNAVFTEIAGVTEDGDVILKQPYIKGLKPTDNFDNPEDFREALRDLGLSMLSDIGAVSAVGKVGTRYALFDDLHGENVMRDKNGRAQLVDALATRLLSADEYTSVSPYLKDPEVLTSASVENNLNEGAQPLSNLDTQNGNRTRTTLPSSSAGVESRNRGSQIQRKAIRPNAEPNPLVKEGIRQYNSRNGIAPAIEGYYAPMNEQRARDIAAAFEALPVFDKTPKTLEAYAKLEEEIQQQWNYAINEMGVTFEPWVQEGQPYANSREMVRDVRDNKHIWFFTGGEPHPLLNKPDQDGLTGNDKFRAIHDLFGHASEDFQFGARGEENAWIKHSQMFSPLAQKALTTETRGQNSWVNFGPQNYNSDGSKKNIPAADRPFAPQKVALLPEAFADWKIALDSDVLPSVAVSYEDAFGRRLEALLDKAVPEAPQTPFLPVSEFEQAKASLATLVLGPNSSIKGRSGIVVNFQSPDYSTAGFLLNPERVRGQRPIEPTKQEALEARVTHALTDDFDRATPNVNKVASAPMIVQTLKQADFVASQDPNGKFPVTTFVKLYNDPSSPSGIRWHFVETLDGRFSTQYSSSDRVPDKGRALGLKVIRVGDSAPKKLKAVPAVIQEEAPAPEPVDIEAEQTRILEELDALAQKRDRLLRDQNYKAAGEVYEQIRELEDKFDSSSVAASAPVTPAQALPTGFKQTTATAKDRRETTALSRVMIDPEYQGVRDALEGKQYISYDANETTAKANEFLNSPDFNGNLEAAVLSAGSRLPIEQIVMVKGLAIQRAQKAANAARATMLDPSLPIQVRNNASVISTQYQKISDRITDDLMEMGSLAGQELRAFRLLADALVPRTWVKKYKQPIIKAQREKLTNDPVFKDMMARIAIAQKNAANSTTTRMKKALAMAAAKFVKDTSVEEVTAYEDFARAMASGMPVKDDVMKAAIEMVVVSGMETVKKSVAPNEQVDPSFLKQWEDKLRSIASEQLNGIIESRLQGGKVDAEAQADLTEEQKAEAYEQKIMDAWRDFSDFPLAEMVFNLARTTIVASDSPYASLVQKAQFDPAKIKRLQQAVKLSINTKDEIRKSLGDKNMSVESLKLRLQEANPNLTENELGALANAVQEVYNSEVQRASVAALQGIIKAGNRETRKIIDAPMIAKLLPLVNMGAFQDEAVYNALADKFNLPTWTQESADKIEALANGVQALPEGSNQRGEAGQQMLLEILQENIKDSRGGKRVQHYSQIAAALWTAGVLSGPSTQIVNLAGTTFSVFLESLSEATGHFIEAKKRGVSTGQATEYYKDIARAWLFAFGKDANNVSLRAMNEVHTGLTRGTTKFKSEKQEDLSLLELFKFDPRVAIPGNTLMEAITTGQWKAVVPALGDLGLGVAKTMAERVVTGDVKGALRDYVATRKMVGRLMLASDATNSFSASTIKQMMLKRTLMQKAGLSESEVNRQMKEIQKGGDATIVNAAKAQAEQEAAEGQFGQSGSAQNISKARRVEQLIEQMTYGNEVIEGGRNYAGEITFNGEPSGLIGLVMMETFGNLNKHLGLVAKPINPFPKTISNLLNNSINYTIYGSFRAYGKNFGSFLPESNEYRKVAPERGSAEFYALHTKAVAGTIALSAFAMMLASAFKDRREKKEPFFELHGPGPKDPKMRAQWVGAGNKPFSMRIGEIELRFTDWPGINIPLGMLGTIYDNAVYGDREADLLDQLFTGLSAVMGTTLDRNMLGGASAIFDILSKNTYDGAKQAALGKFASSYVGGFLKPSDIRYFETIATGGYQDTRGLSGWFKSQIPFVGATNGNPALNVLGEPIEVSAWDATAGRLVSLSNTHPILSPLTTAELLIPEPKAYKISDPSSPTRVRPMEAQELYDFTKIYGEAMRNRLTPEMVGGLVEQAKTAPQGAQDRLTKIAESVRNQAQGELMRARDIRKGKENKGP